MKSGTVTHIFVLESEFRILMALFLLCTGEFVETILFRPLLWPSGRCDLRDLQGSSWTLIFEVTLDYEARDTVMWQLY
jgi:hypothetical protein